MAAMTLKIIGEKTAVARIGKKDVVLLPLTRYQTLMNRLEDLEDILDAQRGIWMEGLQRPRPAMISPIVSPKQGLSPSARYHK